jgi:hypothetical protein
MNQTVSALKQEYIKRLKRQMKLYREYPELFDDDGFRSKYVSDGDKWASLAQLFSGLQKKIQLKRFKRKSAPKNPSASRRTSSRRRSDA